MFTPAHLQNSPDRAFIRALNGMRQIHPSIPQIRPSSDPSAISGRVLKTHMVRSIAPAVQL